VPDTPPFSTLSGGKMQVYLITNKVNGKQYVGQTTKTLSHRWTEHLDYSNNPNKRLTVFHKALFKYGKDAFSIEPLHGCVSKFEMDFVETFYIHFLGTKLPNGYNMTEGGDGVFGYKATDGTIQKIKEARAKQVMPPVTEETRRKMSIGISAAKPWKHGTKTGRVNHKCDCELCRQWARDKWQRDKAKIIQKKIEQGLPLERQSWNKGTARGYYKTTNNNWQITFWIKGKLKSFGTFDKKRDAKAWADIIKKDI
jgi:group I intron endonuclease